MKTIVVGYDGSHPSDLALRRAAELAGLLQARVIVTTVEPPVIVEGALVPAPVVDVDLELNERGHEARRELLERARSFLEERNVEAEVAFTVGPPADQIVEVAERHGADLIVVGTHEPGLLERLFKGSVSQGVARKAHCDVLVVHPERTA